MRLTLPRCDTDNHSVALWLGYKLVRGSRPTPPAELDLSADDVR